MPTNVTQPDQAEGPANDEAGSTTHGKPAGGVSAQEPAEGADDIPAGGHDSPE